MEPGLLQQFIDEYRVLKLMEHLHFLRQQDRFSADAYPDHKKLFKLLVKLRILTHPDTK